MADVDTMLILITVLTTAYALKPASHFFPICHRSDPNLDKCVINSIEKLRPKLVKGIPELQLVPLDPLYVPRLEMRGGDENFKFRQTLTNLNIHGLRNYEILNITDHDLKDLRMTLKCFTKTIDFVGDYDMEGNILNISLKGQGKAVLNFTDIFTTAFIKQELYSKKGVEYVRVKNLRWIVEPGHAKILFTNLFNGDKNLGDATNRILNDNWKEVFMVMKPLAEEAFGILLKELANKVFTKYPKDELYPL